MGKDTPIRPACVPVSVWNGMTGEARAFVVMLVAQNEQLAVQNKQLAARVEQLERLAGINSGNSSSPPSMDRPDQKPKRTPRGSTGRQRGGQTGHQKRERPLIPTEQCDHVVIHKPPHCEGCGADLSGDDPDPKRKQVIDLPPVVPIVTEHQVHTLECPCCGKRNTGKLPDDVPRGWFGQQVVATVMMLTSLGRLSHRLMAELLSRLYGLDISVGQISRLQRIGQTSLQSAHEEIAADVRTDAAVNIDETGWREDGCKAWLWTIVGTIATLFAVRRSRARKVVNELLGAEYEGIVGSDRYSAYSHLPDDRHQFCWAHLLRDFQALIDRGGASARIGRRLKSSGQELIHHWNRLQDEAITRSTFHQHARRLRSEVMDALTDGTRCRDPQTSDFCRRLMNHNFSLFLFTTSSNIAPTNNAAEQSLRRAVIFRKLSFGTESGSGSDVIATTFSVVETCRRLGRDAQTDIHDAVKAHFQNQPPPQLLPQ